jgi:hypothetical protein
LQFRASQAVGIFLERALLHATTIYLQTLIIIGLHGFLVLSRARTALTRKLEHNTNIHFDLRIPPPPRRTQIYTDILEPALKILIVPRNPRKRKHQSEEQYSLELEAWQATKKDKLALSSKGNSKMQEFYANYISPLHLDHLKNLIQ